MRQRAMEEWEEIAKAMTALDRVAEICGAVGPVEVRRGVIAEDEKFFEWRFRISEFDLTGMPPHLRQQVLALTTGNHRTEVTT